MEEVDFSEVLKKIVDEEKKSREFRDSEKRKNEKKIEENLIELIL